MTSTVYPTRRQLRAEREKATPFKIDIGPTNREEVRVTLSDAQWRQVLYSIQDVVAVGMDAGAEDAANELAKIGLDIARQVNPKLYAVTRALGALGRLVGDAA